MFYKIIDKVQKITPLLLILHLVMLVIVPSFLKYNAKAVTFRGMATNQDIILENYSMLDLAFMGIKSFSVILFTLTIIVALLSKKIIGKMYSIQLAILVRGGCVLLNLILLNSIRKGLLDKMFPVGDEAIGYIYYLICDILILVASVFEFLSINSSGGYSTQSNL